MNKQLLGFAAIGILLISLYFLFINIVKVPQLDYFKPPSVAMRNNTGWKSEEDDFLQVKFQIPPDQTYKKTYPPSIDPKHIYFHEFGYIDKNIEEEVVKFTDPHISPSQLSHEDYLSKNGYNVKLVKNVPPNDYLAAITRGTSLFIIKGKKEDAQLIKNIVDTVQFEGKSLNKNIQCAPFSWLDKKDFGKDKNGNYFFNYYFTSKMDENYIKNGGRIYASIVPYGTSGKSSAVKEVHFTPSLSSYNVAPYAQKLTLLITKTDVLEAIGKNIYDQANGTIFIEGGPLKRADGNFCNGLGQFGTSLIKK